MPKHHVRLQPKTLMRELEKTGFWRTECRNGYVFGYWMEYPGAAWHSTDAMLSIADNSFQCKIEMRHSQLTWVHLHWYDAIYKITDVARVTEGVKQLRAYSKIPMPERTP